jgi:hypothetical protein
LLKRGREGLGKKLKKFLTFKSRSKQETLILIASLLLKETQLLFRLDPLGDCAQIEIVGEKDQRRNNRSALGVFK